MQERTKRAAKTARKSNERKHEKGLLFVWRERPEVLIEVLDRLLESHQFEIIEGTTNDQVIRNLLGMFRIDQVKNKGRSITPKSMERYLRLYRKEQREEL